MKSYESAPDQNRPTRRRRRRQRKMPPHFVNLGPLTIVLALGFFAWSGPAATEAFCVTMAAKRSVHVCTNTSCRKAGSRGTLDIIRALAPLEVSVVETGCQGRCGLGPNVLMKPSEEVYNGVSKPATVAAIIEIGFAFPVADSLVCAFDRVSEGDVFYQRGLHAEALACYNQCIDTKGAFEGNANALSVAKVKQSSAMRMVAKKGSRSSGASSESTSPTLEEAEVAAREAIRLSPPNTAAWLHLCDVLVDMGRIDEALETLASLRVEIPEAKFEASEKAIRIRNSQ